jgi:hypothetical protein
MARRIVQECDLTKQEYDPEKTVTIVIKKNGKKTGRTYELSEEAATILEQQLVAGKKLEPGWGFGSSTSRRSERNEESFEPKTLGDMDDDKFVLEKKSEMEEQGIDPEERRAETESAISAATELGDGTNCLHMNKSRINAGMKDGKRFFYRICQECRTRIPAKPKEEHKNFLAAKAPSDSRVDYKKD